MKLNTGNFHPTLVPEPGHQAREEQGGVRRVDLHVLLLDDVEDALDEVGGEQGPLGGNARLGQTPRRHCWFSPPESGHT